MKGSSIVSGSHFVNEDQCIAKLNQLSKMEGLVGIVNNPHDELTPRQVAKYNLVGFLILAAVAAWFFFPFQLGKKEIFIFIACLFITGLLVQEVISAPGSYLDSLFNELEKYKPLDVNIYLKYSIKHQIDSKQLNISATREWIIKEKASITSYMDKNCFFYDDDED